jgi:hypothetical protein
MLNWLDKLDRRWIFLMMFLAVALPILLQLRVPQTTTELSRAVFEEIDKLSPGDKILIGFDYEPGSEAELGPMATSVVHQCCEKKLKMYFMTLWPAGPPLIEEAFRKVIQSDYPEMVYGQDYVNLGYKSGYEGVIKVIVTDLPSLYTTDYRGTSIEQIPMCRGLKNIQSMKLIMSVSAGYPGTKEWIQYAGTPYADKLKVISPDAPACRLRRCSPTFPISFPASWSPSKGPVNMRSSSTKNTPDPIRLRNISRPTAAWVRNLRPTC